MKTEQNTPKKKSYATLLPRMAVSNIRKNASAYLPYMGISVFAMFTYFVFNLIRKNEIMYHLPKGAYTLMLISIGSALLVIIMVPFLYYVNSFLIKRRKRELGLYSILGMEKKHIGVMMFWESVILYVCIMAIAIVLGLSFSRLMFLLLLNLAKMPVNVAFTISPAAILESLLFYAFITGLNLAVNLVQVGKANPMELMSDSRKGEKEPRHMKIWGFLGLCALGLGYRTALLSQLNSMVFTNFFLAVFLVIIGTYLLFTSGSILVLRFLKGRKKFYYRPEHFVTVSGMLYRMKKSAASLSNICVFSTMVIITAVCTVVVYLDMENIVSSDYRRVFEVNFFGQDGLDTSHLPEEAAALAAEHGLELTDELAYSCVSLTVYRDKDTFRNGNGKEGGSLRLVHPALMTLEEYEQLEEEKAALSPDEVLLYSSGADFAADTVTLQSLPYSVKEELSSSRLAPKTPDNTFASDYLIVLADKEQVRQAAAAFGMDSETAHSYYYGFRLTGEEADMDTFSADFEKQLAGQTGFAQYADHRERMSELESMYGGLLFIGIFFGSIFLICLLIILYYKQIAEGFEDRRNFEVMQQVGMSDGEIRHTIRTQISMVFGFPLVGAILHTAVGMRMVYMLLGAIGFFELPLLTACSAAGCMVFAIVYCLSYKRTSMAYYRIVKQMN